MQIELLNWLLNSMPDKSRFREVQPQRSGLQLGLRVSWVKLSSDPINHGMNLSIKLFAGERDNLLGDKIGKGAFRLFEKQS